MNLLCNQLGLHYFISKYEGLGFIVIEYSNNGYERLWTYRI